MKKWRILKWRSVLFSKSGKKKSWKHSTMVQCKFIWRNILFCISLEFVQMDLSLRFYVKLISFGDGDSRSSNNAVFASIGGRGSEFCQFENFILQTDPSEKNSVISTLGRCFLISIKINLGFNNFWNVWAHFLMSAKHF